MISEPYAEDDPFSRPEAAPILRAIEQAKHDKAITERCCFCHQLLEVSAGGAPPNGLPTIFRFSCPCGKSDGFMQGL